ncbi:ABC transporter permease [Virgibacillus ndiopensis]|uniref:ABC transporter permease n=1 Tax=Virgibacillus ndiopensis TaxID=2004408 RepID=UPI00159BA3CF|nr:FtsX-like permease family protein [Virgibacillus ndiopensis]
MLRFIWNSWWRNKERFLLLIVGALIVSIGLSYLVGITQANKATVVDELQKRWKSSYHIVVRPPDARSVTEEKKLLEPNYLSGIAGGISLEQYEQVKAISDIDIAAPIAMMGYIQNSTQLGQIDITEPGVYRMNIKEATDNGVDTVVDNGSIYFTVGTWEGPSDSSAYGVTRFDGKLHYGTDILLAGVDPDAEAKLVGIDEAIVKGSNSKYLSKKDNIETIEVMEDIEDTKIPVILSNQEFVDGTMTYTIEKVDIPFAENPDSTMEMVKENGGKSYLDEQPKTQVDQYKFTTSETHKKIIEQISNGGDIGGSQWMRFKPSPVEYREVSSPYGERWPFSYEVEPYTVPSDSTLAIDYAYRQITSFGEDSSSWPRLQLDFKGIFDPRQLNISKDPLTELPMETYFPSKANWVLDKDENPINPPQQMKPLNNPYGFLTKPPLILTNIEAAAKIIGDKPISAIRVKVKDVEELTEESEQTLQDVAKKIEEKTGLITDITLGSSPQPALTHIPGLEEKENLGWVEQPWIKLGSSMTIFKESKIGMSGVIASVIAVAIVYVFSTNIIMMYARKKEFAVLLSIGWRPNQLTKLLFIEATMIGVFVSIISWLILGSIYVTNEFETSVWRLILIGIFGLSIYVLGTLIPGFLVRKISPYETIKTGEISNLKRHLFKTKSIFSMGLKNLLIMWKRSILSVIAIALPTSLLIFFLFVTFQLKGTMFTTWLGEFVAMEVGPMHYVAMGVAIAIAILTTAEIIWQNVAERQTELAALKAFGWHNRTIRTLVLIEGGLSGLLAGLIGLGIAFGIIFGMYGKFPTDELLFLLGTILIPIVTGIVGAILPARKAVIIQPYQGLTGGFTNSKRTEKSFRYVFGTVGICLFLGIVTLLMQAIPDTKESNVTRPENIQSIEGTSGEVQETIEVDGKSNKSEKKMDKGTEEEGENIIDNKIENAWRVLNIGDTLEEKFKTFTYKLVTENPENIKPKQANAEFITISAELIDRHESGSTVYQPQKGDIYLLDGNGIKYNRIDYEIVVAENWSKIHLNPPAKVKTLLTFEVPENVKQLVMIENSKLTAGDIVVKIK